MCGKHSVTIRIKKSKIAVRIPIRWKRSSRNVPETHSDDHLDDDDNGEDDGGEDDE